MQFTKSCFKSLKFESFYIYYSIFQFIMFYTFFINNYFIILLTQKKKKKQIIIVNILFYFNTASQMLMKMLMQYHTYTLYHSLSIYIYIYIQASSLVPNLRCTFGAICGCYRMESERKGAVCVPNFNVGVHNHLSSLLFNVFSDSFQLNEKKYIQ